MNNYLPYDEEGSHLNSDYDSSCSEHESQNS